MPLTIMEGQNRSAIKNRRPTYFDLHGGWSYQVALFAFLCLSIDAYATPYDNTVRCAHRRTRTEV